MSEKEPVSGETRADAEGAPESTTETIPVRALLPFLLAAERKGATSQVLRTLGSLSKADPDAAVIIPAGLWQGLTTALATLGICTTPLVHYTASLQVRASTLTPLTGGAYRLEFKLASGSS